MTSFGNSGRRPAHPFDLVQAAGDDLPAVVEVSPGFKLIADPGLARALLADTGRSNEPSAPSISGSGPTLAAAARSAEWKVARKATLSSIGRAGLRDPDKGAALEAALRSEFDRVIGTEARDLSGPLRAVFGRATTQLLASHEQEDLSAAAQAFMSHVGGIADGHRQLPRWHPRVRRARSAAERLRFQIRLAARRPGGLAEGSSLFDELARTSIDDDVLINFGKVLITGAWGAPGVAFAWMLVALERHPDMRAAVEAEIQRTTLSEIISESQSSAPVTTAAVRECLRLTPPIWLYTRSMTSDFVSGAHRLQAGTEVGVCAYASNRYSESGGAKAEFRLPQCVDENRSDRPATLSFGFGPRSCVGAHLAETLIIAATALCVKDYRVVLLDPEGIAGRPDSLLTPTPFVGYIKRRRHS